MELLFKPASIDDIEAIYLLCKNLIDKYEDKSVIDYQKVLLWVKNKIEKSIILSFVFTGYKTRMKA